jgi:3',5'-cyclic AMP phosphodiesterase CpdA
MKIKTLTAAMTITGLSLAGLSLATQANPGPERLFLQQVSTHSAVVKWRGGEGDKVCYSRKIKNLSKKKWPRCVTGVTTEGDHMEAHLTGLAPDKNYYYSVGGQIDQNQHFNTAPNSNKPPKDGNTHILIVGDSGTITDGVDEEHPEGEHPGEAQAVLDGYYSYNEANGNETVDLFLALGDNAYEAGTDEEWQKSFFELYTEILSSAYTLPTIGNHEMGNGPIDLCFFAPIPCGIRVIPLAGGSASPDPASYDGNGDLLPDGTGMPYLDIFSLPSGGESGGVPSGTEQYYSVDYGNVHVVSLDTQLTARDDTSRAAMQDWLMADLAHNNRDWTIVIFHHPPYSKGTNHDTDDAGDSPIDRPMADMRTQFTPIFEQYGVDVVYSGHSHSYERSYYLNGHTGTSDTFSTAEHAELIDGDPANPASGRPGEPYSQLSPTSGGIDDRVVYTVAGSSGKANSGGDDFGITDDDEWLVSGCRDLW